MQYYPQTITLSPTKILIILLVFLITSCASISQKSRFDEYNKLIASGKYLAAANIELEDKSSTKNDSSDLLIMLQAGAPLRYLKQYDKSSALFDEAEFVIKQQDEAILLQKGASQVGATLVNDAIMNYRSSGYDGVMVNTYKALNFWQQGKTDLARVEFNRALERQRRVKIRFATEIAQQKEDIAREESENSRANIEENLKNPELHTAITTKYPALKDFKAYPDFVNPFTVYMAGLFSMSQGDYQKSATLFKHTLGMVGHHTAVQSDMQMIESLANGKQNNQRYTWVIFENGLSPVKEEFRIDLPILLVSSALQYTGIALPKLKLRKVAYNTLNINTISETDQTRMLASMDRVIQTEFDKQFPWILSRAVTSAAIKTAAQYFAREVGDNIGYGMGAISQLGVTLYQVTTTSADIRMWTALPKEFQLAKIKTPADGRVTIGAEGAKSVTIQVPKHQNSLIYIKSAVKGAKWIYDVIPMQIM